MQAQGDPKQPTGRGTKQRLYKGKEYLQIPSFKGRHRCSKIGLTTYRKDPVLHNWQITWVMAS